jgi:hypothetical protein
MTVKEYITSLLSGLNIPEAYLVDTGLDLEADYVAGMDIGGPLTQMLAGLILAPQLKSVSENGFSMQWDTALLGKYYLWLCKKYGIKPDSDIIPLLDMSSIIDITDTW